MPDQKNIVFSNLIWRFLERCGAQLVTFIVSIVLARILDPVVYGSVALVMVITNILQVFVDSGLGNALIQKKDADDADFSTVFYFNVVVCIILFIGLFFFAPVISGFYDKPELTPVIRVLGIILLISGVKNIQQAYVSRYLLFKKFFFATLGGTIAAAVAGISLAYFGFGVWALVAQYLVNAFIDTVILWFAVKWRPKRAFSLKRLKGLLSFGWKLLVSALLDTGYNELRKLIIGKKYSSEDLAFYDKGEQFPKLIVTNVNTSISSVLFPVLSREQSDRVKVKSLTQKAIRVSSFVMWPLMMGLAVCAEPLVRVLLTDKWLFCVPFIRIFCFSYVLYPIHTSNLNAMQAMGRSDLFLTLEVIKKTVGIAILLATMWFGPLYIALGLVLSGIIGIFVNSFPNKKILGYSALEQIKDILPSVLLTVFMGAIVYSVIFLKLNDWLTLSVQVVLGVAIYVLGAKLFKMEGYLYCINTVKGFLGKFKKRKNGENKVKKLLLLGGSRYLLPVIKTAREMGVYVITCDYLPDNIAHKYSDEYVNASIIDKEAILKVAKDKNVDGIMSFATDPGVVTAAYVAEKLNLPSCGPYGSVNILQNKVLFRKFLSDNGFNVPKAKGYSSYEEAEKDFNAFRLPVIVKPADSAGSKGVSRVEEIKELKGSVDNALKFSHCGSFIVEEFIEKKGCSSDTDCFSVDGELKFVSFSRQMFDEKAVNPYTPAAYSWPSTFSEEGEKELKSELQRLLTLLKMRTSIYNVETREGTDGKFYIMEVSPRGGGNRLAEMLKYATGADLVKGAVMAALGEEITDIEQKGYDGCWAEFIIHSDKSGVFTNLNIDKEFEKKYVVERDLWVKKGEAIKEFTGANEAIGTLVLRFETQEEMNVYMKNIYDYIEVEIE